MTLQQTLIATLLSLLAGWACAQGTDDTVVQAREALKKKDGAALLAARQAVNRSNHPLTQWVDYWELGNRLAQAQHSELEAFYARWRGTYVEDRLRNDWLLELGKRRDWANFRVDYPRFRMNDDREVTCYALLTQHLDKHDVRVAARNAWFAQRDLDDGCDLLAKTLREARQLDDADIWQEARLSVEANRPRGARAAIALLKIDAGGKAGLDARISEVLDQPARFLDKRAQRSPTEIELDLLALMRLAATDPDQAAERLRSAWDQLLPAPLAATAWAHVARQSALKLQPQAMDHALRAWQMWDRSPLPEAMPPWSDEVLAWHVRAALRAPADQARRWVLVQRAIDAMTPSERNDSAWVYWRARAVIAQAVPGAAGDAARAAAKQAMESIAQQLSFYGRLANEELGQRAAWPAAPQALSVAEREVPRKQPGFNRALQLIGLGLRSEGVREWNFTLRGLSERELLAAAQYACDSEVWDRCINTRERTRSLVDMTQRFPMPHRQLIEAKAKQAGLDPALVFGLIRQESRFITDARSVVGASGLMQLMPATAQWTAKQVGLNYTPQMINDHEVNLQLGAAYFKRVMDDLDGSLAMAAAAYNAGPGRPRRWRDGAVMEPAAWAESIPFNETRDYVKKVLSNSVDYATVLGQGTATIRARLGKPIGPRDPTAPAPNKDLP